MPAPEADPASNLAVVEDGGTTREALSSGRATFSNFFIAPSDKLYLQFQSPVNISDTNVSQGGCLLAEVSRELETPTCIDDKVDRVTWRDEFKSNDTIQFDAEGAIYYLASAGSRVVLRRHLNGTSTDLINDNITIYDFIVLPDGAVVISGQTNSSGARWVRLILPNGNLRTIYPESQIGGLLSVFPDGNVYFGIWNGNLDGVLRYQPAALTLDPRPWTSYSDARNPYLNVTSSCQDGVYPQAFCGVAGALVAGVFRTLDGSVFGLSGTGSEKALMKYYPTIARANTTVADVTVAKGILSSIVLAGTDVAGTNVMTLYDTATDAELELVGASNEIEVYHVSYLPARNRLMFDGLRFADNQYVLGEIDVSTRRVTSAPLPTGKLLDFQTFR